MSEYILHCPSCAHIIARNINYSVQPGTIVEDVKCPNCGELIEIAVELTPRRKGVIVNPQAKILPKRP